MIVCVYALVRSAPARWGAAGVAGEPLRTIAVGRIRAVVGDVRRAPAPNVRNLRRYAAVIDTLASKVPAILPARFGSVVPDVEELMQILRSRGAVLAKSLQLVRARSQMTLRVFLPLSEFPESEYGDAPYPSRSTVMGPDVLRLRNRRNRGTQYLRQKMAEAAAVRAIPRFEPIRVAAERYAKAERVEKRGSIVTVNHLVARAETSKYRAVVERAAQQEGVRMMVTGPFPPYAFADTW